MTNRPLRWLPRHRSPIVEREIETLFDIAEEHRDIHDHVEPRIYRKEGPR